MWRSYKGKCNCPNYFNFVEIMTICILNNFSSDHEGGNVSAHTAHLVSFVKNSLVFNILLRKVFLKSIDGVCASLGSTSEGFRSALALT
jgi:hypothetical protein